MVTTSCQTMTRPASEPIGYPYALSVSAYRARRRLARLMPSAAPRAERSGLIAVASSYMALPVPRRRALATRRPGSLRSRQPLTHRGPRRRESAVLERLRDPLGRIPDPLDQAVAPGQDPARRPRGDDPRHRPARPGPD